MQGAAGTSRDGDVDARLERSLEKLARVASTALALLGASILLAWWLDWPSFVQLRPDLAGMKPNTAVGFVLFGVAFRSLQTRGKHARLRTTLLGVALSALAAATLSQRVFGWDLGIDGVLVPDGTLPHIPRRMSIISATHFLLLGAACSLHGPSFVRFRRAIGVLIGLSSLLALLGYLFGADSLYAVPAYHSIALHTSVAFVVTAFVVLWSAPEEDVRPVITSTGPGGVLARRLLPAAIVLPCVIGFLCILGHDANLYDTHFGVALFALATIACFSALIFWTARRLRSADRTRRVIEARLSESETRFRHLAQSGILGIVVADTSGNLYEVNEAFLDIVGYSREELLSGQVRLPAITPPEWLAKDRGAVEEFKRTGAIRPRQKEYLRKDGTRAPVLVGGATLHDARLIAFALDLRELKRAEAESLRAESRAREAAAERARAEAALKNTEEQLRQSQKLEAIGTLAGGVAHDFNNLLSVILGYTHLMLDNAGPDDENRADLEQIAAAGARANDLTRQLLAFSRQQVLAPVTLNLNDIVAGVMKMLQRVIGEDIEIGFKAASDLGQVSADPGQVEQVLMNLIVNARDAMPAGGKITIETANAELDPTYTSEHLDAAPGRYVVVSVSDTGTGMDQATQARIFEPFFTTKEQGKGTGLGLSTAFGIVRQSGGSIWVYSEVGQGTTFKVYLPRLDGPVSESRRPNASTTDLRGTETVLLVEDDAQLRELTALILSRNGYSVIEAANGDAAVRASESESREIDLLLTDVVMPAMSGRVLWERLSPTRPKMKVLFMSGYTDDAVVRHGVLSSELPFLQKPVMAAALLAKLRAVLGHPR